jgi:hypothetical protein
MRLLVKRKDLTLREAEIGVVREVVKVQNSILKDEIVLVAFLGLMALFALVIVSALSTNVGERPREAAGQGSRERSGTREFR